MAEQPKRIAILFHENDNAETVTWYVISVLKEIWLQDGHEVTILFGTAKFVPADVLIMHVDLSVVPDRFFAFAKQYPVVINGRIRDITKSRISSNIVRPNDGYDGKVIVKSNLNAGGKPECERMPGAFQHVFKRTSEYRIFDHSHDVPPQLFLSPQVIVEKFIPEMRGDLFSIRNYYFFGDNAFGIRILSEQPIVNGPSRVDLERIEPHPDMVALRHKMMFDYGKFDYVEHEGKAVLIDANKTMGAASLRDTEIFTSLLRFRAEGLYSFFNKPAGYGVISDASVGAVS